MPTTDQPSSAPQNDAPQPTDDLTAAAVMREDAMERPVGGGGLGAGAPPAGMTGAETPNSPMVAKVPRNEDRRAEAEARVEAVANAPAEPGHSSQ